MSHSAYQQPSLHLQPRFTIEGDVDASHQQRPQWFVRDMWCGIMPHNKRMQSDQNARRAFILTADAWR